MHCLNRLDLDLGLELITLGSLDTVPDTPASHCYSRVKVRRAHVGDDSASLVLDKRVVGRHMRLASDDIETCTIDFSLVQRPSEVFRIDYRPLPSALYPCTQM